MLWTVATVLIVGMDNGLGIAVRVKPMPERFQIFTELLVVINLSIENYPGCPVGVVYGLLPACQINDGETAHPKANPFIKVEAVFIWPAMDDGFAHSRNQCAVHLAFFDSSNSYNSTHDNL
jgi:hypothetical protein